MVPLGLEQAPNAILALKIFFHLWQHLDAILKQQVVCTLRVSLFPSSLLFNVWFGRGNFHR